MEKRREKKSNGKKRRKTNLLKRYIFKSKQILFLDNTQQNDFDQVARFILINYPKTYKINQMIK